MTCWINILTLARTLILSWNEMRDILKNKYIPNHYMDELLDPFLNLSQNTLTVAEYSSQFEQLKLQYKVDEEQRLLLSRFMNDLRANIKHELKLQLSYSLDIAYKKTLDYEKYLRTIPRHSSFTPDTRSSCSDTFPRSSPNT